jgi:hypothetical protein
MKMEREHHYIELTVEKALTRWSDSLNALAQVLEQDANPSSPAVGKIHGMSDELDQQTADHCLVSVHALSDLKGPLKAFIKEVNSLAQRMGGKTSSGLMSMLMTSDCPDEIRMVGDEIVSIPVFYKTFTFF